MILPSMQRLQTFVRAPQVSYCDLCGVALPQQHTHLSVPGQRALRCACLACGSSPMATGWHRVDTLLRPVHLLLDDNLWASLGIPINLAFLLHRADEPDAVGLFPSPAGLTETPLPTAVWEAVLAASTPFLDLRTNSEALLAMRLRAPHRYYVASLDVCYEIAGILRLHWRGLSGGTAAHVLLDRLIEERLHA